MDKNINEEITEVLLYSSVKEFEISQICALLEDNNIPFIRQDGGSGSYMNLYMGQSAQEKRIIVTQDNYEKALEIITPIISKEENIKNEKEDDVVEEDNIVKKSKFIIRIIALIMLCTPLAVVFISMISTL